MVLTSAKAMSASDSRFNSSSRVILPKTVGDRLVGEIAVAHALDHVGDARIGRQIGLVQHLGAERLPLALALDRDQDVLAVLRGEHAVGRDRGMAQAHPLRRIAGFGIEQRHGAPVRHHVEHGDADVTALAGAPARDQRFQDRRMRGGAGRDVDDRHADARGAVRVAGDRGKAALGLDQQIIGLAVRVGAFVAIAGDRAARSASDSPSAAARAKSRACPSSPA